MILCDYANLLNRSERAFDEGEIDAALQGKKILITGAGGSIGSALALRVVLQAAPGKVYLLGHGEDSLFQVSQKLKAGDAAGKFGLVLADVYSKDTSVLLRDGIDFVFHTAAHKHVGILESAPRAAFANNTQATIWLARKCEEAGTRLIYLSTDKAVKPTTVLGASKKLAEAWIDANCKNAVTIRLGNVLGSAGSLVEIVERLSKVSGKFILNHPDMCRYFVTVKEAVGLILSAGVNLPGKYTLDMGQSVRIEDLIRRISPGLKITERVNYSKTEKLEEDLREYDEWKVDSLLPASIIKLSRKVEPKLVGAILEIIEDNANSGLCSDSLGKLMVDMANRV